MTVLVTGAAGFIGFHLSRALLDAGERVVGVDNLDERYDVALKQARLDRLTDSAAFRFLRLDIADPEAVASLARGYGPFRVVVHLAARAGVRDSLKSPWACGHSNLMGHLAALELCRGMSGLEHFVYASSSSVYGGNVKSPQAEHDRVDMPISLYAATKRAGELMAHTYSHLHGLPATGLRFFTVYGPWGRPDMAVWAFTEAILAGRPIRLFNSGDMKRDFTCIDDIIAGVFGVLAHPPDAAGETPHRLYNIGGGQPEPVRRVVAVLERALGREALVEEAPPQPGDVSGTFADVTALERDIGFRPATRIDEGLPRFVAWYREHYRV